MDIEINIERLRLEGVERMDQEELAALVQDELARLIETYGMPDALRRGGAVEIGNRTVRVTPGASRRQIGREIAQGIAGHWYGAHWESTLRRGER
jgi:hypothetical protein